MAFPLTGYSEGMTQLRIALAQVNPTVGDIAGNCALVVETAHTADNAGADLLAFPEMVITGYPIEDLALRPAFITASTQALTQLATTLSNQGLGHLPVVVGYLSHTTNTDTTTPRPQNCAAILHQGTVHGHYAKHHLPNYGVFDEHRIFAPGTGITIAEIGGANIALAICEDLWQVGGPVAHAATAQANLLLVLNGSPYERHKDDTRLTLTTTHAHNTGCAVAYVNCVGGQDDLVFDGDSHIVTADGNLHARAPQFTQTLLVSDVPLPTPTTPTTPPTTVGDFTINRITLTTTPRATTPPLDKPRIAPPLPDLSETYRALVLGLRDYVHKNGFSSVCLGASGGIDSALVATIAADALGGTAVVAVSMPSQYSSNHSQDDAADLAKRLNCHYRTIAISDYLTPYIDGLGLTGVAAENIQARIRGNILMALSNSEGHLVLATSNKTEISVGYSTMYGDSVGGFAPIKDVPKTLVWELSRWRNTQTDWAITNPIPQNSIDKPPSAELRPDQTDQDTLPEYALLDDILARYVDDAQGRTNLLDAGYDAAVVDRVVHLVDTAEWKRRQSPIGTKVSGMAFGRDRRLPITSKWREHH